MDFNHNSRGVTSGVTSLKIQTHAMHTCYLLVVLVVITLTRVACCLFGRVVARDVCAHAACVRASYARATSLLVRGVCARTACCARTFAPATCSYCLLVLLENNDTKSANTPMYSV